MHMRNGRLLALLVVLVFCIAVTAPPALSATYRLEHRSLPAAGQVDSWNCKGEGGTQTVDDDRWGGPNGNGADSDVESGNGESEDDERPSIQGSSQWRGLINFFLFGNWFVL
jgi:hypothetical protein